MSQLALRAAEDEMLWRASNTGGAMGVEREMTAGSTPRNTESVLKKGVLDEFVPQNAL